MSDDQRRLERRLPRRWAGIAAAACVLGQLLGWLAAAVAAVEEARPLSRRSHEVLDYDCYNSLDREDVTLFWNGTIRLRGGPPDENLWLVEIGAEEADAYVRRLEEIPLADSEPPPDTVAGTWTEHCLLTVTIPGKEPQSYRFGVYDTLSLELRRVVEIAKELRRRVDTSLPPEGVQRLPSGYEPKFGDLLRHQNGHVYEVIGFTADGNAVELQGRDEPFTLYVQKAEIRRLFVRLEKRSVP